MSKKAISWYFRIVKIWILILLTLAAIDYFKYIPLNSLAFKLTIIYDSIIFVSHSDYILDKISRTIDLLFKLNKILPQNILLNIYNTLLLPYYTYGIILWHGSPNYAIDRVSKSQKNAIRAICQLEFNGHTCNSFKELCILKIHDLYRVNLCVTMFKIIKNPTCYPISANFSRNSEFHNYPTWNRINYSIPLYSRTSSQACFVYQASIEFNNFPQDLKGNLSINTFRKKLKMNFINQY